LISGANGVPASAAMAAVQRFDLASLADVVSGGGIVVIAPHPDDESLGCGGLIAEACAKGVAVRVIVVSDGTGSHTRSRVYPRLRLRALREAEARRAVSALGLPPRCVEYLRLPDRFVPSDGARALSAVQRIVEAARTIAASAIFVSWRHDPHCDHVAAYRLALSAQRDLNVNLYEYSVWGATLKPNVAVTAPNAGFRLQIERHRARKQRAIALHKSQVSKLIVDDPNGFRLTKNDLNRFAGPYESFIGAIA
jgi:LmbE family N-acetylglucosaminyl deacetylase